MRFGLAALLLAGLAVDATAAPSEAEQLFEEGRALAAAGQHEAACEKFEQSIAKDPRAVGVLLNLAACNERTGKLATALKLYREALDRATEANLPGSIKLAQDQIDKLVPRVPVLELARSTAPLDGEKLVIDETVVAVDTKELPVDPGSHLVTLTAPGRLPFQHRVELRGTEHKRIVLPALEVPKDKIVERESSSQRLFGTLFTFGGTAVMLVGGGLAYYAKHDYDGLFEGTTPHCGAYPDVDGDSVCDKTGQDRAKRDRTLGTTAIVTGFVGLAIAATGIVLWATAPSETPRTTIVPTASDTGAGVLVQGTF